MKRAMIAIAALSSGLLLAACDDTNDTDTSANQSQAEATESSSGQTGSESNAQEISVSGTLSFAESGQSLPENAEVTVRLLDVALADAPAKLIAEKTIAVDAQAPLDFTLSYASNDVDPRHMHSVRATIHDADGNLKWTSTVASMIDVGADADQPPVNIVLQPVGAQGAASGESMQETQENLLSSGDEPTAAEEQAAHASPDAVSEEAAETQEPSQAGGDSDTAGANVTSDTTVNADQGSTAQGSTAQ